MGCDYYIVTSIDMTWKRSDTDMAFTSIQLKRINRYFSGFDEQSESDEKKELQRHDRCTQFIINGQFVSDDIRDLYNIEYADIEGSDEQQLRESGYKLDNVCKVTYAIRRL